MKKLFLGYQRNPQNTHAPISSRRAKELRAFNTKYICLNWWKIELKNDGSDVCGIVKHIITIHLQFTLRFYFLHIITKNVCSDASNSKLILSSLNYIFS